MPSLNVKPSRVVPIDRFNTVRTSFPAAVVLGRARNPRGRLRSRRVRLEYELISKEERGAIVNLFDETLGGANVFDFVEPGESASRQWRFVSPALTVTAINRQAYRTQFEIEAVTAF